MKWSGKIGFQSEMPVETSVGVYEYIITEYKAVGEEQEGSSLSHQNEKDSVNRGIRLNISISVIASKHTKEHMHNIVYITYNQQKWSVSSVTPRGNRLILNLGGLWHDNAEE